MVLVGRPGAVIIAVKSRVSIAIIAVRILASLGPPSSASCTSYRGSRLGNGTLQPDWLSSDAIRLVLLAQLWRLLISRSSRTES